MSARPLSIFYGYPPELIARWCGVTVSTARRWKAGTMRPARAALRLFGLYRDGRALGDAWHGWTVRDGVLVDPEGNQTTQGQLRAYGLVMQLAADLARRDPEAHERYRAILKSA